MKRLLSLSILLFISISLLGQSKQKTQNVVLVTLDGFRWQEVFNGGDSSFMRQQQHLKDPKLKEKVWRDNLSERRKA